MGQAKNRAAEIAKLKDETIVDVVPYINELCEYAQECAMRRGWTEGYEDTTNTTGLINQLVAAMVLLLGPRNYKEGYRAFVANKHFLEQELCAKYGTDREALFRVDFLKSIAHWSGEDKRRLGVMDLVMGGYRLQTEEMIVVVQGAAK